MSANPDSAAPMRRKKPAQGKERSDAAPDQASQIASGLKVPKKAANFRVDGFASRWAKLVAGSAVALRAKRTRVSGLAATFRGFRPRT